MKRREILDKYQKDPRKFREDLVKSLNCAPLTDVQDLIAAVAMWDSESVGNKICTMMDDYHGRQGL